MCFNSNLRLIVLRLYFICFVSHTPSRGAELHLGVDLSDGHANVLGNRSVLVGGLRDSVSVGGVSGCRCRRVGGTPSEVGAVSIGLYFRSPETASRGQSS